MEAFLLIIQIIISIQYVRDMYKTRKYTDMIIELDVNGDDTAYTEYLLTEVDEMTRVNMKRLIVILVLWIIILVI